MREWEAGSGRVPTRRPPDRRHHIAMAARELFLERGYHNVSMADVASAVGITAPALYRHYRNKQDLLLHVVREGFDFIDTTVRGAEDVDDLLRALASVTTARRGLALLWQREARYLSDERRAELGQSFAATVAQVSQLVRTARPDLAGADADLVAWSLMAIFSGQTVHRPFLPQRRLEALLVRLGHDTVHCPLGAAGPGQERATADVRRGGLLDLVPSRREQMLTVAVRLFDERGFQSVSTQDIGEAVGTTGPNLYKHFPSKTDLLMAGIRRGGEHRQLGAARALADATDPRTALLGLVDSYIDFALEHHHLLSLVVREMEHLPEQDRRVARQGQREYLALWADVLDRARPGLDPAEARMRIHTVLGVVDAAARTGRLAQRPDIRPRLAELSGNLLLGAR